MINRLLNGTKQANIAVRNFPLTAPQLRKKLKLADGGPVYLFGTTMQGCDHVLRARRKSETKRNRKSKKETGEPGLARQSRKTAYVCERA